MTTVQNLYAQSHVFAKDLAVNEGGAVQLLVDSGSNLLEMLGTVSHSGNASMGSGLVDMTEQKQNATQHPGDTDENGNEVGRIALSGKVVHTNATGDLNLADKIKYVYNGSDYDTTVSGSTTQVLGSTVQIRSADGTNEATEVDIDAATIKLISDGGSINLGEIGKDATITLQSGTTNPINVEGQSLNINSTNMSVTGTSADFTCGLVTTSNTTNVDLQGNVQMSGTVVSHIGQVDTNTTGQTFVIQPDTTDSDNVHITHYAKADFENDIKQVIGRSAKFGFDGTDAVLEVDGTGDLVKIDGRLEQQGSLSLANDKISYDESKTGYEDMKLKPLNNLDLVAGGKVNVQSDMEVSRKLTVKGDLTVEGTMITSHAETRLVEDSHLVTNSNLAPSTGGTTTVTQTEEGTTPNQYSRGPMLDDNGSLVVFGPPFQAWGQTLFANSDSGNNPYFLIDYMTHGTDPPDGTSIDPAGTIANPAPGPFFNANNSVFASTNDHVGKWIRVSGTNSVDGLYQIKSVSVYFHDPSDSSPPSIVTTAQTTGAEATPGTAGLHWKVEIENVTSNIISPANGETVLSSIAADLPRSTDTQNGIFTVAYTNFKATPVYDEDVVVPSVPMEKSGGLSVVHTALEERTASNMPNPWTVTQIHLETGFTQSSINFIRIDGAKKIDGSPLEDVDGIYQVSAGSYVSGDPNIQIENSPTADFAKPALPVGSLLHVDFTAGNAPKVTHIEVNILHYKPGTGWCMSDGTGTCEKLLTTGVPSSVVVDSETQSIATHAQHGGDVLINGDVKRLYILDTTDNFTLPTAGIDDGTTVSVLATVGSSAPGQRSILNAGGNTVHLDFDLVDSYAQFTFYGTRWFRV